ncbi:MAG: serine/threonine-protein kinase [Myxococcota bacterium]
MEGSDSGTQAEVVTDVVGGKPSPFADDGGLAPGSVVGRCVVQARIGAGGMGIVYLAQDPTLDRPVALKLLRPEWMTERTQARLLREAQALAQLSHPNVVTVYGVERSEYGIAIIMEYVEGETLARWLTRPHHWHETLRVMIQAGQGLHAAHEARLIHRDFKPSNVRIGSDGRVQVLDFGLVRLDSTVGVSGRADDEAEFDAASSSFSDSAPGVRTGVGEVLGTVAYMAPEQLICADVEARSDQYAFCVSLWEALCGQLPFRGDPLEVLAAKQRGVPRWPSGVALPHALVEAIGRGLAPEPADRWPSVDALLRRLRSLMFPARQRWRWALGGSLVVLGGGLGLGWWSMQPPACQDAAAQLEGAWGDLSREVVHDALLRAGGDHPQHTWTRVEQRLDEYATHWGEAYAEACEQTHVRAEVPPAVLDLRMACLRRARVELGAAAVALGDPDNASRAIQLVDALPPPGMCLDETTLHFDPSLTAEPERFAAVEGVRHELAEIGVLEGVGDFEGALLRASPAVQRARATGFWPVVVEALVRRGRLSWKLRDSEGAQRDLDEAYELAESTGYTVGAARSAIALSELYVASEGRYEDSLHWANTALALARRDQQGTALEAEALERVAIAFHAQGRYSRSAELQRQVLDLQSRLPEVGVSARSLQTMANALLELGRLDQALDYHQRALEQVEQRLGPNHVAVGHALNNYAAVLMKQGRHGDAISRLERVIQIREAAFGPDTPRLVSALLNLAAARIEQEQLPLAEESLARVLEIIDEHFDGEHPHLTTALTSFGLLYARRGEVALARESYDRAVVNGERTLGEDHPRVALALFFRGVLLRRVGEPELARGDLDRALRIRRREQGDAHSDSLHALIELGFVELARGDPMAAKERADEALEILASHEEPVLAVERAMARVLAGRVLVEQGRLAEAIGHLEFGLGSFTDAPLEDYRSMTAFALARALWGEGGDRDRALTLARQARRAYRGPLGRDGAAAVARWLGSHRLP